MAELLHKANFISMEMDVPQAWQKRASLLEISCL